MRLSCAGLVFSLMLCGGCDDAEDSDGGPDGTWVLAGQGPAATCPPGFGSAELDEVSAVAVAVADGMATFSAEPCVDAQDGPVTSGESGFIANLENEYGETATLTCDADGDGGFVCEHTWLDGDFTIRAL